MKMNLSPAQMEEAFQRSLKLSHDSGLKVKYHLTRQSYTTVAYQILDGVASYNFLQTMFTVVNWLPNWPEWHLYWRGLSPVRVPSVNDEFADYAKDKAFRQRLRDLLRKTSEERKAAREDRRTAQAKQSVFRRCFENLVSR